MSSLKRQNVRHIVVVLLMLLAAFSVSARVAYVHIEKSEFLKQEGERHYKRNIPLYAYRGDILDRNGYELAVSAPAVSIWADPDDVSDRLGELKVLNERLDVDLYGLKRKAEKSSNRSFMYIKRQISPEVAEYVKQSSIDFVSVIGERKRVYPEGHMFSQIVGVTDIDGQGVEGAELSFNQYLNGENGIQSVIRDRLGRSFEVIKTLRERHDGENVVLSLDRNIQYIAFSELRRALQLYEASSGMLVILDVNSGKVLSMANYPAYNPNERSQLNSFAIRNRIITDVFEPGSAIKPFIVAAALESGVISEDQVFDVSPGYIRIAGKKIKDSRDYKQIDVAGILGKSSNVGVVKIASMIDDDFLAKKLRSYGLFSSSGIELPGESSGLFLARSDWNKTYKYFLSFGYGAAVSALQLASGYAVLANNGIRKDISVLEDDAGSPGVQVMDPVVAGKIVAMLQKVVDVDGTGRRAALTAYSVAGKTGTAKKLQNGSYSGDEYIAVFCGMAPASKPEIVIAVIIDGTKKDGFYGGQFAAPIFSNVASRVLRYLDVKPDRLPPSLVMMQ